SRSRAQVTYEAMLSELPEGVFFKIAPAGGPLVRCKGKVLAWSFEGYSAGPDALPDRVEVLTPEPTVKAIAAGYVPMCSFTPTPKPRHPRVTASRASGGPRPTGWRDG
ncbi:MAG: hypothetical protein P1U43_15340, partial [Maricaulis sp.]|nr:hypothetical protein [Maricaulis sp.]